MNGESMTTFLIVFSITLLSALIQTVTGFGSAIIMMALMPLFLPYTTAVLLSLMSCSVLNIWLLWKYRRSVRINLVLLPTIFAALVAVAGVLFGLKTAPALYMRMLGLLLFALSLWFLFFVKKVHIKQNRISGAAEGCLHGVLGARFTISGPALVLYFNAVTKEKRIYMGALQATFLVVSVVKIIGRITVGLWPEEIRE